MNAVERERHEYFMRRALLCAAEASERGEVPVGAVLVSDNGEVLAQAGNAQINTSDPTAHAEIRVLRAAATVMDNYRLPNTTLYVSLEPCTMCCGALVHARIDHVVFAAREPKAGAVVSTASLLDSPALNHQVTWSEGVLAHESASLLKAFFAARRKQAAKNTL